MFSVSQIMLWILNLWLFFAFIHFSESSEKLPYSPGVVCNLEAYYSAQSKAISKYFCVPDSHCRKGFQRFPLMPYDGCGRFMQSLHTDTNVEELVCCHEVEISKDWTKHRNKNIYLPGVRSYMMCKHHSHAICGPQGSYCEADYTDAQKFRGLPTLISKYPHTALIGYFESSEDDWVWYCQGSIVSNRYILTVWECETDDERASATNVKIGESRICPLDHCPDRDEEQNLKIVAKFRQNSSIPNSHDLALFQVAPTIQFNKNVRPACLYYELDTRQTQGWFARYGKPDTLINTRTGKRPLFMSPRDDHIIAFKVKTAGEARIFFSKSGLPYKRQFSYDIVIGAADNSHSMITRSDAPNYSRPSTPINTTANILSADQFRGFWINVQPHEITVGTEDSALPFLSYSDDATEFHTSAMGLSTPYSTGEWIIYDYGTLASLHDFEMQDTFSDECQDSLGSTKSQEINGDSTFCAIDANKHFGPCNNDWGGSIQIMDEEFYCMWQIFGVLMRDSPKNCSVVDKSSLFKSLNTPEVLAWVEGVVFELFSISTVKLERPLCTGTYSTIYFDFEGRCTKPMYPR